MARKNYRNPLGHDYAVEYTTFLGITTRTFPTRGEAAAFAKKKRGAKVKIMK